MDRLPTELMLNVLEKFSRQDLKSVRLAAKMFNPVSSKLLFKRAFASVHLKDLEVLSAISRHPTLRLAVCEIVYVGVYFHYPEVSEDRKTQLTSQQVADGRRYYRARAQEQEETRRSGEDVAIISAALVKMPNVRQVTLTNDLWRYDDVPLASSLHPFSVEPHGTPLRVGEGMHAQEPFDHGFKVMCKAVSISGRQIETLLTDYSDNISQDEYEHLGDIILNIGIVPGSFICSSRDLQHYCNAFQHMREISFKLDTSDPQKFHFLQANQVARVLAAATCLEKLTFGMDNETSIIPLSRVLGTHTWQHLHYLNLESITVKVPEFVGLLRRHSRTLKKLVLYFVTLAKGRWVDVAHMLQRFEWPVLASLESSYLYETPSNVKAQGKEVANCIRGLKHGPIYEDALGGPTVVDDDSLMYDYSSSYDGYSETDESS
ncbi:hypothetical protein F4818DRAFT_215019 [Hypoxylon cercidicola]|nr:hypothetical protein F4818DRAFT_215019 [Hypoxylon cercidicola]